MSLPPTSLADNPDAGFAAALSHRRAGRAAEAKALCRKTLRRRPQHAGALHMLGTMAREEGRLDYAVQLLTRAAASQPSNPEILCDLGNALKAARLFDEAERRHLRVVELMPDSPEALSNLGATYKAWGRLDRAIECYLAAAERAPDHAEIQYNLGNGLLAAGRFDRAEDALRRAVRLDPGHVRALVSLGVALKEQRRLAEAAEQHRAALDLAPGFALAGYNLALALLMAGDYRDGWRAYEYRRRLPDFAMRRIDGAEWDGGDLAGQILLVHAEQGLGDTIQFMRYLTPAMARGGDVTFLCQPAMKPLLSGCAGMPRIVDPAEPLPDFDVHAPLLSLPHLLGDGPPSVPGTGAYVAADPARVARWAARLNGAHRWIGIAWQGRPDYGHDKRRSVALEEFAPLARVPGVRLVSLQKGAGANQLAAVAWRAAVEDLGPGLDGDGAFVDTAAVVVRLDLVVTTDTSIAHLAGALGVETWVALAHVPDWRWGLAGETTPWYPLMRLFRQDAPGDWAGVFARLAAALRGRA